MRQVGNSWYSIRIFFVIEFVWLFNATKKSNDSDVIIVTPSPAPVKKENKAQQVDPLPFSVPLGRPPKPRT